MNIIKKILLATFITTPLLHTTPSIITLFLQKYPYVKTKKHLDAQLPTLSKALKQPDFLYKKSNKGKKIKTGAPGVLCLYLGYTSASDQNGQIIFPRKQQTAQMNILITKSIKPVFMIAPTTLHNWIIDTNLPTEMYSCSIELDSQTELYYIKTEKITLPEDKIIPLNTIIIISDPQDVYVPEGGTISHYYNNLILPNIYIKKDFDYEYNALKTATIRQYFGKINRLYQQEDLTAAMIMHT